jgi:hypothetical protein
MKPVLREITEEAAVAAEADAVVTAAVAAEDAGVAVAAAVGAADAVTKIRQEYWSLDIER